MADNNPTVFDGLIHGRRSNASHELWALDRFPRGSGCARGQLFVAAVVIAAEFKVTRKYDEARALKHTASLLIAARKQLVAFW